MKNPTKYESDSFTEDYGTLAEISLGRSTTFAIFLYLISIFVFEGFLKELLDRDMIFRFENFGDKGKITVQLPYP